MKQDTPEAGLHQSISRASAVLDALATGPAEGLRLTDVVAATGLGKTTVHRMLAGLVASGLAEQDDGTGRFVLGMRILSWAASAGERFGLARLARPVMERLARVTLDTVYLTIRSGDEAFCLERREGGFPIKTLTLNVGDRRPLGVAAGGLALLAFQTDREIERILALQAETRVPMPFDQIRLRDLIAATRRAGFAFYDAPVLHGGDVITGMAAVGVPIRRANGLAVAALSVAAITGRLQPPRRDAIATQLRTEAAGIEAALGPVLESALPDLSIRS